MNSTQLHYREATRELELASMSSSGPLAMEHLTTAQVHASLAVVAALQELTKQAAPTAELCVDGDSEAVAEAVARSVGVMQQRATDNILRPHAWDAF